MLVHYGENHINWEKNDMEKSNIVIDHQVFVEMLKQDTPFAFARFNDGEMGAITKRMSTISRGDQLVTDELSDSLRNALQYEQLNYWKGLPCSLCYPQLASSATQFVGDSRYICQATLLTNRHFKTWLTLLPATLKRKTLVYVHGKSHNIENVAHQFDLRFNSNLCVPDNNAWGAINKLKEFHQSLHTGAMVLLCCGPISRVLIPHWFKQRPDCTFLDMGSWFDPWARNVRYRYHLDKVPPCAECN